MELLFILVSFCLGITFSQLIDPPEIAIPIPRIGQYSNKNKEATLECRVESKRLAIVTWKRHGRPILHGRSKYQLSKNVRRYGGQVIVDTALRIRNIRDPDFGEYVCSAWIYGIRKEASIVLYELNALQPTSSPAPTYHSSVITTPSDEETSTEGHDVPLITIPYPRIGQYSNRNKEAIMECRVISKNNAIVTWKRHGRTILNRNSKYLVVNGLLQRNDGQQFVDSVLRILNISDSDFGQYVCFARINGIQVGASVILYELFTKQPNSSPAPTDYSSIITTPSDDGTSTESHGITGTALERLVVTKVAMATREIRKELEEVKAALMKLKRATDADREKMKKHFQKFVDSLSSYM